MKIFTRVISVCLVFVMLCGMGMHAYSAEYTETGYYGNELFPLDYPVTSRFMNRIGNDYQKWYQFELPSFLEDCKYRNHTEAEYFAGLWLSNYHIGDPEVWPECYLESIEPVIAEAQVDYKRETADGKWLYEHRVDDFSWSEDTLTVECSADYYISYRCNRDTYYAHETYNVYTYGDYYSYVCLALTDKNDGSLVHMGEISDFCLKPEHKFKYEVAEDVPEEGETTVYLGEELKAIADTGDIIGHEWTATESFEVQMPEFFDPDEHDVTLYFYVPALSDAPYLENYFFHDPYKISADGGSKPEPVIGDVNGDGLLDLADVILSMKHIAGWNVTANVNLGNLNTNDRLDMEDVTTMLKLIAGWDISL